MTEKGLLTSAEYTYCNSIHSKDCDLRAFVARNNLSEAISPLAWLTYLVGIKDVLGNLNNDISFLAGLLVKPYLRDRFGVEFDFGLKPQGAPGLDIDITNGDGTRIVAEIKTTRPYQPGFGANQKNEFRKNLDRLAVTPASHRFMFVTDRESFEAVCATKLSSRAPGVEIVNILTRESYLCRAL